MLSTFLRRRGARVVRRYAASARSNTLTLVAVNDVYDLEHLPKLRTLRLDGVDERAQLRQVLEVVDVVHGYERERVRSRGREGALYAPGAAREHQSSGSDLASETSRTAAQSCQHHSASFNLA